MLCKNCGKEFEKNNERHIYCSDYCRVAAHQKKQSLIHTCKSCGNMFNGRVDALYCSDKCRKRACRKPIIYTIGYSQDNKNRRKPIKGFIKILKDNKISSLRDVRGTNEYLNEYGKGRLSATLLENNIEYLERKEYGVPKGIRSKYKKGDMSSADFENWYRSNITVDIQEIKENTVLMCWELYPIENEYQIWNCHRSILAKILMESGKFKKIIHL